MLRQLKIGQRLVLTSALGAGLVLTLVFSLAFQHMKGILIETEERVMAELSENLLSMIESEGRRAESMAALVASMPQIQTAFAEGDRQALESYFRAGFAGLRQDHGVRQFQFHRPPALSFLRVHKPDKFGDDLASFRRTVVATNATRAPIRGLEVGVAGLGVRGVVPVFHQGRHVGSVEFGLSVGQDFVDQFSRLHAVDLDVHLDREGRLERLAGSREADLVATGFLRRALAEGRNYAHASHDGRPVGVLAIPLPGYDGQPVGVLTLMQDRAANLARVDGVRNRSILLGLVSLLALVGLTWWVATSVVNPLRLTTRSLQAIGNGSGNLAERLDTEGNDEISALAGAYNQFVAKLAGTVERIVATTDELAGMARRLSALSEQTSEGTRRQREQVGQVATAMTEMSATVQEVAQSTSNTAEAAGKVDQQSIAGQAVVRQTMETINELAREVGEAVERIARVEQDSERIGSVLDVIRGIAEQTNLLALNAAIEAARAGEQGRGFAVVAEEVRTLASRTQDSTREIQAMIESLQAGVHQTVETLQTNQRQAGASVERAHQAHDALVAITGSIDTITSMSAQIATAAEEQSAVAEDINRNVVEITGVADQTAANASQSAESTEQVARDVQKLVDLMAQFDIGGPAKDPSRAA